MSLFPAYSKEEHSDDSSRVEGSDESWLQNPSFTVKLETKSETESDSDGSEKEHRARKKRKKKRRHERKTKIKSEELLIEKAHERMVDLLSPDSSFYVDRKGSKNNTLIPTLMKTDAPLYGKPKKCFSSDFVVLGKKRLKWRYFNCSSKMYDNDITVSDQLPAQTNEDILLIGNAETQSLSQNLEIQFSKTTASYNQQLTEDPHNEELWLQYVDFQDKVHKFEKQYKRAKENSTAFAERKLSILDKALTHNPLSELLLFRKLDILSEVNDLDKMSEELFSILRQDFGNLGLWNRYIRITQCIVSRCTVPKVTSLYAKAMEKVNFMQKHGILTTELNLIELFTSCALFLRQCGLWEQLCMLIRLNLQLNLSTSTSENYKVDVRLPEEEIKQLEDEILMCGLPIYSLWLRLEKLRQRVHWYPVSDPDCEDPQRLVMPTDVTDLVRPITTPSLSLRIAVITMFLLKVPLIPFTDSVFRALGLHSIPWLLDSAEVLLSAFCSIGITQGRLDKFEETIASCLKDLVSRPQYVNDELGRIEFLDFVQTMFRKVARGLPFSHETVILVWWSRFERTLLIAGRQPPNCKKRLKSSMKDLLKEERHRNNLPLFIEYALLEKELNQSEAPCVKVLETALLMHPLKKTVFHVSSIKNSLTQLYRVTVEVLLVAGNRDRSLRLLIALALSLPEKEVKLNDDTIKLAVAEYQRVTDDVLREDHTDDLDMEQTQPQFLVEWVCCQAWFLFLTESIWSACSFLEELQRKFPFREEGKPISVEIYYRELITEILITILHFHCSTHKTAFNVLNDSLRKGINEFPNNMRMLCTLSDLETKMNFVSPWWKIEKCLRSNDSHVARLFMILLCRRRLISYEQAHVAAMEILGKGGSVSESGGLNNRMKALLLKLTKDEVTKECPLIWRIYLQYCSRYETETKFKDTFYMAIEKCPWVKSLYMETAQVLLDQVSQIQDFMVEKEMRIHITQDEIDILRDS